MNGRIRAILSLLEDEDEEIVGQVRRKLFELGEDTVREILDHSEAGSRAQREAERVLHGLKKPALNVCFQTLVEQGTDLETGAFLLARFAYPDLEEARYRALLDRMATHLSPQIAPDDHPLRVIRTLNQYLFEEQGFKGKKNYGADPDDSYLNRVIDRKTGLPIALSVIYLLLGRRLDLPLVGINMPAHFLINYKIGTEQNIFLDPFHHGQILTKNECADMLAEFNLSFK
ncbi:MAG: transglutaminase-like domain-containing protein, partial [bacterium]|nr:transglutaminase-like domain-containing protein [bacterium]